MTAKVGTADQHADRPHNGTEKGNRKDNPESGKPGRISQNFRTDDISVQLLQNQDENTEHDCRSGIDNQQQ